MPVAGPFYFAWVEPDETTFDETHHRMDEHIFSATRTLAEGEKPLLEIEIQNPHVGILSPSRKYWAWFSWDNGDEIVPLFFGRVVGSPIEIFEEVIQLQLVADPIDYKQRLQVVAETLKVPPFWDPVFIDVGHRDDPNTVLEAHTKVWDVDPVTYEVTANDIILGDSNEDFTADDHFYDGMQMTIGQPPATAIQMDASVPWTQTAHGSVDIGNYHFNCLNGDSILSGWPKPQADIGGGYRVLSSSAVDNIGTAEAEMASFSYSWQNKNKKHHNGDALSTNVSWSTPIGGKVWAQKLLIWHSQSGVLDPFATDSEGDPAPLNIPPKRDESTGYVMGWDVSASLVLQYDAAIKRTERVKFEVRADTQAVLTSPELSEESEAMTRSGADVGDLLGGGGEVHSATYFATDRGRQSLEYLAALVRARLLYRSRCIEIQFDCDYLRGTTLTTRKTATLHDPRIAGGIAVGKITGTELSVSDTGIAGCKVTIACCAGKGNAVDVVEGDPSYVAAGYVEPGYQWYDNETVVLPDTTDLGYAPPFYVPSDNELTFPLTRSQVVAVDLFHAGADVSGQVLENMAAAAQKADEPVSNEMEALAKKNEMNMLQANSMGKLLQESSAWQEFQFRPCTGGPFHKSYDVAFSLLTVPMGIDLQSEGVT